MGFSEGGPSFKGSRSVGSHDARFERWHCRMCEVSGTYAVLSRSKLVENKV